MKKIILYALVLNLCPELCRASNDSDLESVFKFISDTVEGVALKSSPSTFMIEKGKLEADSWSAVTLVGLERKSNTAFTFILKTDKQQTNYRLNDDGKRIEPGEVLNSTHETMFIFTKRQSTGRILGIAFDLGDSSGYELAGEIKLEGENSLVLNMRSATDYVDAYSAENASGRKAAVLKNNRTFSINERGLYLKNEEIGYDVDLESGSLSQYAAIERVFNQ
jgi:hypothetical protein